MALIPDY